MSNKVRVLILEDQMMVAFGLKAALERKGMTVVGPFGSIDDAHAGSQDGDFDVAVLDVNLGGDRDSTGYADHLTERNTPYLFMTGYGSSTPLPPRFSRIDRLIKPVDVNELVERLTTLAEGVGATQ